MYNSKKVYTGQYIDFGIEENWLELHHWSLMVCYRGYSLTGLDRSTLHILNIIRVNSDIWTAAVISVIVSKRSDEATNGSKKRATERKGQTVIVTRFILIAQIMELVSKPNVPCSTDFSSSLSPSLSASLQWKAVSFPSCFHLSHSALFIYWGKMVKMGNAQVLIIGKPSSQKKKKKPSQRDEQFHLNLISTFITLDYL